MKLVSTIIPAWNAAPVLAKTVRSALAQTWPAQEIVIVDDGSTDDTGAIAEQLAARHPAVRVVHQANRGLSGARNRGIEEAAGDYVAPLDADDLWHPEKLSRQVAAMEAMPGAALAYGWFRRIDQADRVLPGSGSPVVEGWVFHRHLADNFISNGSSPLVRTEVARAIRYDESYRSAEDYRFQLDVARRHRFACARAYLTGYRLSPDSMSRDVERMIRSHLTMFRQVRVSAGGAARTIIDRRIARLEIELLRNRVRRGRFAEGGAALARGLTTAPVAAAHALRDEFMVTMERSRRPMFPAPARPFADYAAETPDGAWRSGRAVRRDTCLAALDAAGPEGF